MEVPEAVSAHRPPAEVIGQRQNRIRKDCTGSSLTRFMLTCDPRESGQIRARFLSYGSACGPVIVPVFKSKKLRRFNGLRTITAHTATPNWAYSARRRF